MSVPKCTKELIATAEKLKKGGALDKDIAAAVGVAPETFCRWCKHPKSDPQRQLSQAMRKAEAAYKNSMLAIIAKAAKERDWKAAAWLLERKYPDEYARRERVTVDGQSKQDAAPRFYFDPEEARR